MELFAFVLQCLAIAKASVSINQTSCYKTQPIWSNCQDSSSNFCGDNFYWALRCDSQNHIWIQACYCLYYDEKFNTTIAGTCLFSCFYFDQSQDTGSFHIPLYRYPKQNYSMFNQDMCNVMKHSNRQGRFCGRCKKEYGLPAYSYHYTNCIPCKDYGYKNWFKVLAAILIPMTAFYVVLIIFKISITTSYLNGLVLVTHCSFSPIQMKIYTNAMQHSLQVGTMSHTTVTIVNVGLSFISIFNLDFARSVFPQICLHPNFNSLHFLSMELIIGLYPFALILLTFMLVKMHDYDSYIIVVAWKHLKKCIPLQIQQYQLKSSLIQIFATFILLASAKLLSASIDLLLFFTTAYNQKLEKLNTKFFYYDPTIEYFSSEHLPYALVALVVGFIFILVPFVLLLFYPCSCSHKLLNMLNIRLQALHIFMDAFHGNYKIKPYDMRYFAAFYFFQRVLFFFLLSFFHSNVSLTVAGIILLFTAVVVTVFQPYKNPIQNQLDTFFLTSSSMSHLILCALYMSGKQDHQHVPLLTVLLVISMATLFTAYMIALLWAIPLTRLMLKNLIAAMVRCKTRIVYHLQVRVNGEHMRITDEDCLESVSLLRPVPMDEETISTEDY